MCGSAVAQARPLGANQGAELLGANQGPFEPTNLYFFLSRNVQLQHFCPSGLKFWITHQEIEICCIFTLGAEAAFCGSL